jgi:DNA topoisomerase-6 subunit B
VFKSSPLPTLLLSDYTGGIVAKAGGTAKKREAVTQNSAAEYFSKNLQQVGFSSPTKAVLTTLKEAVDNALDACEEAGILPELYIEVRKIGAGTMRNTDRVAVKVVDNGPGIDPDDIPKVFGEYLASSKFGRGRCSRGQQGIGISAATTWALQTAATGAFVISKTKDQRKAQSCVVAIDLKNNKGIVQRKEMIDWDRPHGTSVEFIFDGRILLNGEGGLITYLKGTTLVNPHLAVTYVLPDEGEVTVERISKDLVEIPEATAPHPHTMKLGEFISHAKLFGNVDLRKFLKTAFSRMGDAVIDEMIKNGHLQKAVIKKSLNSITDAEFAAIYKGTQDAELRAPSTDSVISVGEDALAKSIKRLGEIDYFSVISRKPAICDFKPVLVEVAIARYKQSGMDAEEPVQVLRFANRVPLQFDKAGCAIVKAIQSVNWRAYGLRQPKDALPQGPFIIAVSVVSPFIKFKNASKETIDTSDELVEEIRRSLMQAGQKLSRHLRRETMAAELEERIQYIEKFGPILVEALSRIVSASKDRKQKAEEGLMKILGRDAQEAKRDLRDADEKLAKNRVADPEGDGESEEPSEAEFASDGDGDEVLELQREVAGGKGKSKSKKNETKKTESRKVDAPSGKEKKATAEKTAKPAAKSKGKPERPKKK